MSEVKFKRGINPSAALDIGVWSKVSSVDIYFLYNIEKDGKNQMTSDVYSSTSFYIKDMKPDILEELDIRLKAQIDIIKHSLNYSVEIRIFIREKNYEFLEKEEADEYRKMLKTNFHHKTLVP